MKSIRSQMFIYLVLATLAVFSVFGIWIYYTIDALPEYAAAQYQEMADARADELSKELQGFIDLVEMTSQSTVMTTMDMEVVKPYLKSLVLEPKIRNMTVSDLNGNAWTTYDRYIDISDQEQYQRIILNGEESVVSDPFESPYIEEDVPIITISKAIKNDGETLGLVNAVVSTSFLDQVVAEIKLRESGLAWIVDENGDIVSHPEAGITIDQSLLDLIEEPDVIQAIKTNESGSTFYTCVKGQERIAIYSQIEASNNWKLIVSISREEAYAEIDAIKRNVNWAYISMILLVSVFSFFYSRTITKPILELKTVFEHAANGNLSVRANEAVKNEVGAAGKSFNVMINQLKILTFRDPITNIYNYNRFMFELSPKLIRHQKRGGLSYIVVLSVDDFMKLNSIGGHDSGNHILKELAEKLKAFIREDELVATYFGDEMILLLCDKSELLMSERVQTLIDTCSELLTLRGIEYMLNVNAGISIVQGEELSANDLVQRAKIAKLMTQKAEGNRFVIYNEALHSAMERERQMEEALHHGIERNEFRLVYQPIVDIHEKTIFGHEALMRWNNTEFGQIAIPHIIEMAEKNGDILAIGAFVLESACRQNNEWIEAGKTGSIVSVNVSPLQFEDIRFVESVKSVLKRTGMDPSRLEIEITETNAMLNVHEKIEKMHELKEMGIKIAVDDFGTGYSSLAYFTQFPIDTLKIDRSFVNDMCLDANAKAIVAMIINMAKTMGIKTTAEGVETLEQFELLKEMGADRIQGYLISKPDAPDKLPSAQQIKEVFGD